RRHPNARIRAADWRRASTVATTFMTRLRLSIALDYDIAPPGCDFIFNVHAAQTERQRVVDEALRISQDVQWRVEVDPNTRNRHLRLSGRPGPLTVEYQATVDLLHHVALPYAIAE